jgi:hypothetical protein
MAEINPKLLDVWVSDTIWLDDGPPKTGSTGTLDTWVSDTIWLDIYAEAEAPVTGNNIPEKSIYYQRLRK